MSQICTTCNIEKKLENYYFRNDTQKHRKNCKDCMHKQKNNLREKNKQLNANKETDLTIIKECSLCFEEKQLYLFSKKTDSKSGFYSWCLDCSRKKDNNRTKKRINYSDNHKKCCSKCDITKTILDNFNQKWGSKDGFSNICKKCNSEARKLQSKELYKKKKHKLDNNIQFKLSENLRARLRAVLKNIKIKKPNTTKILGCSLDNFIIHLEHKFYQNMSFENYGTVWQLDHIIPCNYFDLTNLEQLKACTHYTNLQPLLIKDNSIKSDKLDWIHPIKGYQITFLRLVISGFLSF